MNYGDVVESLEKPSTYGTVHPSDFGVSIHYWTFDRDVHRRVLIKTIGASAEDASRFWKVVKLPAWGKVEEGGGITFDYKHCPVCGSELREYTDYLDGHTLCEEQLTCERNGCYHYEYAYGSYSEWVGEEEAHWSYTATSEIRDAFILRLNAEIIKQREAFHAAP